MMKNTIYLFVLSLLIGFSSSAFASYENAGVYKDQASAFAAYRLVDGRNYASGCIGPVPDGVPVENCFRSQYSSTYQWAYYPDGCPEGQVADSTGKCGSPCESGQSSTASYYIPGYWSVGAGESNVVQSLPFSRPTSLCDGQCRGNVKDIVVGSCSSPGDGTVSEPKPIHCDFSITLDGSTCSGGNGNAPVFNPDTDKLCANGASDYPTCTPAPTTCANGATDFPTCTQPTCANGAADYPACTGSPQTGTCNNGASNYPACTTGGSGSGSGGSGGGSGTCANGASNYPTCTTPQGGSGGDTNSKIDESGTPTGVNSDGSAALDDAAAHRITGFSDNTKVSDVPWTMTFAIHNTSCSPINWSVFGRVYSIDLCPWLSKPREALAYLWYGLACIYCWKRVSSATGGVA